MEIVQIPPHHVVAQWPRVEHFLAEAMTHSAGECSLDQLKALLTSGQQTLLVVANNGEISGAITLATESYPNFSVAFVTAVGGKAIACRENFEQLFAWCKAHGYTHIRGAAYESVARLWRRFGAREIYRTVEIEL